MFFRFTYATHVSFNDAIISTPIYRKKGSVCPTVFTGKAIREFKVKAETFDEAKTRFGAFLNYCHHEVRSLQAKNVEHDYEQIGSEVLIDGNWHDTSRVCHDCLNGIPHEHRDHLYSNVRITGNEGGYLEFAA